MAAQFDFGDGENEFPKGFRHFPEYFDLPAQTALLHDIRAVLTEAPLFVPVMPRTGKPLSVRMSNCGSLGWLTDKAGGYRYQALHPDTGKAWPPIPRPLMALWRDVTADAPEPQACLINWYEPGARMGLHVDRDEDNLDAPVVSVSLGDDAWFRIGGLARKDPSQRLLLKSGDVAVLGGASRLAYHGVDRILQSTGTLLDRPGRINLTLRRVRD